MEKPNFVNVDGTPTEDGRRLIEWIESHFVEADKSNDIAMLNSLSGDIQHYYVNVYKLNKMTGGTSAGIAPAQWLRDYKNSFAMSSWRNWKFTEAAAVKESQLEATTAKTAELEAGLNEFKEAVLGQIAKLQEDNAALQKKLDAAKKGKRTQQDDTEGTDAESEA